jgi:hypothetical protein
LARCKKVNLPALGSVSFSNERGGQTAAKLETAIFEPVVREKRDISPIAASILAANSEKAGSSGVTEVNADRFSISKKTKAMSG